MQMVYNNPLVIYLSRIWCKISIQLFGLYPRFDIQYPARLFHGCNDIGLENYIKISSEDAVNPIEKFVECEYKTKYGIVFLVFLMKDNEIEIIEYMLAQINPHQNIQEGVFTDDDVICFNSIIKNNETFKHKVIDFCRAL